MRQRSSSRPRQGSIQPNRIKIRWRPAAVLVFAVVLAVSLWLCGRSTNLLRDQPPPDGGMRGPFSLAKVQMAWWLFFVAWAFLFICVAVGDLNSVTTSTLVLLGIS